MSVGKKILAQGAGYLSFFFLAFTLCLYWGFDANILKPLIEDLGQKKRLKIEIQDLSLRGLAGLELKDVNISPAQPDPEKTSDPMKIDRLVVSSSIFSLPGMIAAARTNRIPPTRVSFSLTMGTGKISGKYGIDEKSFRLDTSIKDLPLDRITLPAYYYKDMKLAGKVNAEIKLDFPDQNRPETWNGTIEVDIDKPRLSDFQFGGVPMAGMTMEKGTLIVAIKEGNAKLNPLKLQGNDMPLSLTGTIALKQPLGTSIVDIGGPFKFSDSYKEKNPLVSTWAPSSDKFNYKGTLSGLAPGL